MPYKYKHPERMDSFEKISRDRKKTYPSLPGSDHKDFSIRKRKVYESQDRLDEFEFNDQMAARNITLQIDLRNKYQIKNAIQTLQAALAQAENEVYEVPNSYASNSEYYQNDNE